MEDLKLDEEKAARLAAAREKLKALELAYDELRREEANK